MANQPNIIILHCDDRRHSTIRCLGNDQIRTPHIDALVERGTVFTHACNPGGMHGAVCIPSRAMLHSGRTLFHLEGRGETIPSAHTTLGEVFRASGYTTHLSGKWHNDAASLHRSFSSAQEVYLGGMSDHWNLPVYDYDPTGRYDKRLPYISNPHVTNRLEYRRCDHIHLGVHSTDVIADAGEQFLTNHPRNNPYLLVLAFVAPHDPRTTHQEYLDMYDPDEIELPPNFSGGHPFDNGSLEIRDELLARFPRRPDEIKKHIAEYYAMLTHFDDRVGTLMQALKDRGDFDNTIVVHCADHGLALGQHGLMGKQNLYDHSLRVPMILAGPGIESGVVSDEIFYALDLYPTLCNLASVTVPETVEGNSMIANSGALAGREELYVAYIDSQRGVRTKQWKLIEYAVEGRHNMTQLFDMQNDPWEMQNLAEDDNCQSTLHELRARLVRMSYESGDRETEFGRTFWDGWQESATV